MRVAFFGSPAYSLPSLEALHARFEVVLVVSQPDKPVGRGMRVQSPPVAAAARDLGLPLEQPPRLRGNGPFEHRLAASGADVAVTIAYGKILPAALLGVPRHGFLNAHASLLPLYRGAAPVQWALINGERETGVSVMRTEVGLDTGPVALVRRTPIGLDERAPELFARLSVLSAGALVEALELLDAGALSFTPQDEGSASLAPLLKREDGRIDWTRPARTIYDRFRGVFAWPGSFFRHGGRDVKATELRPAAGAGVPGSVLGVSPAGVTVAAGDGAIVLERVQPPGRASMAAREWANGYGIEEGVGLA